MWTVLAGDGVDQAWTNPKAFVQGVPGLALLNRSNPGPVAELLSDPPAGEWVCSVAVSGQKHLVPFAVVNRGRDRWTVRFETADVTAAPDQWAAVHGAALRLRRLGVPAAAVLDGSPGNLKTGEQVRAWRETAVHLTPHLGTPLLELALWTITKETMK